MKALLLVVTTICLAIFITNHHIHEYWLDYVSLAIGIWALLSLIDEWVSEVIKAIKESKESKKS